MKFDDFFWSLRFKVYVYIYIGSEFLQKKSRTNKKNGNEFQHFFVEIP